jgi:hypothetical protein
MHCVGNLVARKRLGLQPYSEQIKIFDAKVIDIFVFTHENFRGFMKQSTAIAKNGNKCKNADTCFRG